MWKREEEKDEEELQIECAEGGEPRRPTPFSPTFPLSARRQAALLKQMESPNQDEPSTSSGSLTPTRKRVPAALRKNERGETPLHVAARKGDIPQCESLLNQGANVNEADYAGWTPLHEACGANKIGVAKLLIKSGADVNANANANRDTPLHDASASASEELISLLLKNNADRNLRNGQGKLPIELIPESSDTRLVFAKYKEGAPPPSSSSSSSSSSSTSSELTTSSDSEPKTFEKRDKTPQVTPPVQERSGALEPLRARANVEKKGDDDVDDEDYETPQKRPTRSSRGGRGSGRGGSGQVGSRRGAPRTAARRGNAKSTAIATSEASPPQRTTPARRDYRRQVEEEMAEPMDTSEKSKRKKPEDVYEFRDEDSDEDMHHRAKYDMPSTSSGPLIKRPKASPVAPSPVASTKKVPPLKINFKPEDLPPKEKPAPQAPPKAAAKQPPPPAKQPPPAAAPKKKRPGRPNKKAAEPVVEPVVVPRPQSPSPPPRKGRTPRKAATQAKAKVAVAGPSTSTAPITSGALEPASPKRLTRSNVVKKAKSPPKAKAASTVAATTPKKPKPYFTHQFEYMSISDKKPEEKHVPRVRPFNEASCSKPPPNKRDQMKTYIMPHPISEHPDVQKVVHDIYAGNPDRTHFTLKNFIKKKMASEKAHKNKVPPRPIPENERHFWWHMPTEQYDVLRRRLDKKKHEKMPVDCPAEMVATWKELENKRADYLYDWKRERINLRLFLERQFIRNRNLRWKHEHGDYTRPLGIFRISWELQTNNPGVLEEKNREPEAPTAAEINAMAARKIEDLYDYHRFVGETIHNVQIATWRLACKRKKVSEDYQKKEIALKYVPNLKAMCKPLEFDY